MLVRINSIVANALFFAYRVFAVPFEHQVLHVICQVGYTATVGKTYTTQTVRKIGRAVARHHVEIDTRQVTFVTAVGSTVSRIKDSSGIAAERTGAQVPVTVVCAFLCGAVLSIGITRTQRVHLYIRREDMMCVALHGTYISAEPRLRNGVFLVPVLSAGGG